MSLPKLQAKQQLHRLIFEETPPDDWVQDVWGLSPLLGDSAAKLLEVFDELCDRCPEEQLIRLLQDLNPDEHSG